MGKVSDQYPSLPGEQVQDIVRLILGETDIEWGILYKDDTSVHVIARRDAAQGIFRHYGEQGDKLVSRLTSYWIEEETK